MAGGKIVAPVFPAILRQDGEGSGRFGSSRGTLPGGSKKFHDGIDLVVAEGQSIYAPMDSKVVKVDYPYLSDARWTGIQLETPLLRCEVWYMVPDQSLIGKEVKQGQPIGVAQDISKKYTPDMTPHVHVRFTILPYTYLVRSGMYHGDEPRINPLMLFPVLTGDATWE